MSKVRLRLAANPILIRELRSRMRGPRAFAILTGFLLLLGGFAYGLYRIIVYGSSLMSGGPPMGALIGRSVFMGLAFFELMLVCVITPALTAGSISAEEERRTLDMLLATPLRAGSVLWGKLVSALTYVFLLIAAAVPMASIVFIFGGVTAVDLVTALGLLVLCAVTFGTLGLFFSAWLRRTGRATVASYGVLILLMFGSYFLYILAQVMRQGQPPRFLLFANPIAAMASAVGGDVRPDMLGGFGQIIPLINTLSGAQMTMGKVGPQELTVANRVLWHYTAGIYVAATAVMLVVGVQLIKPIRRWRLGRVGLAELALGVLLLGGGGYVLYGPPGVARFGPYMAAATPAPSDAPGFGVARAVAVPVRPAPLPEAGGKDPSGSTVSPVPTPATELAPAPLLTAAELPADVRMPVLGEIYAAAMARLISSATAPDVVTLLDTTGVGGIAEMKLDTLAPRRLPDDLSTEIARRVNQVAGVSVIVLPYGDEHRLQRQDLLFTLGRPNWETENSVKVAISRYSAAGARDARVYTLERGDQGWAVTADGGPVEESNSPPAGGLSAEEEAAIYSALVLKTAAEAPNRPQNAILYDTTSIGLLASARVDGSWPRRLDKELLDRVAKQVEAQSTLKVSTMSGQEMGFEQGMKDRVVVITLGRLKVTGNDTATLAVARYCDPDTQDARVHTLKRTEQGWQVIGSGPALKRP